MVKPQFLNLLFSMVFKTPLFSLLSSQILPGEGVTFIAPLWTDWLRLKKMSKIIFTTFTLKTSILHVCTKFLPNYHDLKGKNIGIYSCL